MKHRRFIVLLLCAVLLLAQCLPITALASEDKTFTLRVGYLPGYGIFVDENGVLTGYVHDYMTYISRTNDWNVEYIPCDWAEGLSLLEAGQIDVFGGMQKTPEREDLYSFPDYSMGNEFGSLFASAGNDKIFFNDPQSIDGKTVGISRDNYYEAPLLRYCEENEISVKLKYIDSRTETNQQLQNGGIDMIVLGSMLVPSNAVQLVAQFSSESFYFPTTKGNDFVLAGLNRALEELQRSDPYFNLRLYDKYYSASIDANRAFTRQEQEYLSTSPALTVGYLNSWNPIEYYDAKTGKAKGITIDLLNKVASRSGLNFTYVKVGSYPQALQMLRSGELDLVSGFVSEFGIASLPGLSLTSPFFNTRLTTIFRRGVDATTQPAVLAIPSDWTSIESHVKRTYPVSQVKYYENIQQCVEAVLSGEANFTIDNQYSAPDLLKPYRYHPLTAKNLRHADIGVHLALSETAPPALLPILNKFISSITSEDVNQAIYTHTLGVPYNPTLIENLQYNSIPLILLLIFVFFIIYTLMKRSQHKLNKIAFYDELTGEMNFSKFSIRAEEMIHSRVDPYAIIVIDIDKFKAINDMYGYLFGDKMLIFLAGQLHNSLDSHCLLARGNADCFYILMPFVDIPLIEDFFYSFAEKVENFHFSENMSCKLTLSGGVCLTNSGGSGIIALIDRANIAAKTVKSSHGSRIAFYSQSMYDQINNEKEIENRMASALENHEFIVYLQPKVELSSMRMVGAEALVRWEHPDKGLLMPGGFIPLFETNGFITELDFYVFEEVCKLLERWKRSGHPLFVISVNLSRRHLQNSQTVQLLCDILAKYDADASNIEFELTESALVDCNVADITDFLNRLHAHGFTVSVDDFGSGYSSLSLLKEIPIDVLKIDKSFFEAGKPEKTEILLESVISLSRKMNIKTVSEGVETVDQVKLLVHLGCDLVQGYYFARPMPPENLELILKESHGAFLV